MSAKKKPPMRPRCETCGSDGDSAGMLKIHIGDPPKGFYWYNDPMEAVRDFINNGSLSQGDTGWGSTDHETAVLEVEKYCASLREMMKKQRFAGKNNPPERPAVSAGACGENVNLADVGQKTLWRLVRRIPVDYQAIATETGMTRGKLCRSTWAGWVVQNTTGNPDWPDMATVTPPATEADETLTVEDNHWCVYAPNAKAEQP